MRIIVLLSSFLLTLNCCSQKMDCSQVKTGEFETPTESVGNVIIKRTDSLHIEIVPKLNKKTINKVEWTNDCEFVITYLSGDVPPGPNSKKPIDCEIIEVGEDYHIVRARIRGTDIENDYLMKEKN